MARFVMIQSGTAKYLVNAENVDYVVAFDDKSCNVVFGREHKVYIDHPASEVLRVLEQR